eukprot:Skav223319  [mRNA]  locus=scaffold200:53731:55052:+ [translate_table: standard]
MSAGKPSLTMAYLSLVLACVGVVLSIVALSGVWWHGEINPSVFGGALKGKGAAVANDHSSLSLWGFSTSIDSLGISLPTTFLSLDAGACHDSSPLRGEDCGCGWFPLRLLSCRSQFGTTFLTAVSVACMVCALAVGSSADQGHVMLEFGDMGAAFYCHWSAPAPSQGEG